MGWERLQSMEDMEFYDMKWNVKKKFNDFELTKEKNDMKCNAKKNLTAHQGEEE